MIVDLRSFVFRHEPSVDPARMQIFRQREYVRLGTPEQAQEHRDYWLKKGEEILASALSKYVVKKGRFTVSPERCFRHAGLLPERPADKSNGEARGGMEESKWEDVATGNENGHADMNGHVVGLTSTAAPDALGKVVDLDPRTAIAGPTSGQPTPDVNTAGWDWDQVEKERLRGLELAKGWLALDGELLQEFSRVPGS